MKKFFRFVVVLTIALAAISCSKEQTNSIKVISYNVRCSGGDGENHWDKRKHASLNMINQGRTLSYRQCACRCHCRLKMIFGLFFRQTVSLG